ncbi:MAG: recombination regulator RecX [Desulfuromonadaceae bacterium]|nr:recombination regulator RecX [Desulfuromonadaceae bacterium]
MAAQRSSASDALSTALRLLTVRDRSESELLRRLREKKFPDDEIAAALERCRDFGYLDDRHFALNRARMLLREGRAVGSRLGWELRRGGVADELIDLAMTAATAEYPPLDVLRELLERRYPHYDHHLADDRKRRRVIQFFQRRGFALGDILSVLQKG